MEHQKYSTDYFDTFIAVAEDCPATRGEWPAREGTQSAILLNWLQEDPYRYTSDELLFKMQSQKGSGGADITRGDYFSKRRPCLRTSPLAKRYGWGFHFEKDGRVACYEVGSKEYRELATKPELQQFKAMRSKRK